MRQRTYSMFTFFFRQERVQRAHSASNVHSPSFLTVQMIEALIICILHSMFTYFIRQERVQRAQSASNVHSPSFLTAQMIKALIICIPHSIVTYFLRQERVQRAQSLLSYSASDRGAHNLHSDLKKAQ